MILVNRENKKAWEYERQWITHAVPPVIEENQEENWLEYLENGRASDQKLQKDWISFVPGSHAPSHLVVAAIQSMYNKGYDVSEAEKWIEQGLEAAEKKDGAKLQQITARIYSLLNHAPKDNASAYWTYKQYLSWEDIEKDAVFPDTVPVDVFSDTFAAQIHAGWMGQLVGGALGTQIEGYTTDNIRKRFGEVRGYLRAPETYNDDITYELAFLEGFYEKGYNITSEDIAYQWLALITDGYSAEETALFNLRRGILPPESGRVGNYFSDWIGAQMRTPIHGMVAPGNPRLAAKLAVYDSVISHSNNGILGGMFNSVLVALSFVEKDCRKLLEKTISCIPAQSEYYSVISFALEQCKKYADWEGAWRACETQFQEYHWIHAYPNAAAEIIALWYGEGDFDQTGHIIAMAGQDVDCTAAPVLNALAIIVGLKAIRNDLLEPIGDTIHTMMRKMQCFTIQELCQKTVEAVRRANQK